MIGEKKNRAGLYDGENEGRYIVWAGDQRKVRQGGNLSAYAPQVDISQKIKTKSGVSWMKW